MVNKIRASHPFPFTRMSNEIPGEMIRVTEKSKPTLNRRLHEKRSDQELQDLLPSGCASFFQQQQQLLSLENDNSFYVGDSKKVHLDSF